MMYITSRPAIVLGDVRMLHWLIINCVVLQAVVSDEESRSGLVLQPPEMLVAMLEIPITAPLEFTQFTSTLTGTVNCIGM